MKKNKVMVGALATAVALGMSTPVFAESTTLNAAGTHDATVTYTKDSTYMVTIPKNVTLNADKNATYTVTVTGDIYSTQTVKVTPVSSFVMRNTNGEKDDVTATVSQTKNTWTYTEMGTNATGTIVADGLSAGAWEGTLTFTIDFN